MIYTFALALSVLAAWAYRLHRRMDDLEEEHESVREQAADAWLVAYKAWSDVHDR